MAKDDYDVIAYKILIYLYGALKRKIHDRSNDCAWKNCPGSKTAVGPVTG